MNVNECEWMWMNVKKVNKVNECEWMWMNVNECEWMWMNVNDEKVNKDKMNIENIVN